MNAIENFDPTFVTLAIAIFLLLNLALGLYEGRNVSTLKTYALADKNMGTPTLAFTLIATVIGAGYVTAGPVVNQVKGEISNTFASLFLPLFFLLFALFVFPKLVQQKDCYTLGDIFAKAYGPQAQLITGIVTSIVCLLYIAGQILAVADVCEVFNINKNLTIFMIGTTIILYTWLGGIRSVAATDIFQLAFLVIGFFLITYKIFQLQGPDGQPIRSISRLLSLARETYPEKFGIWNHERFWAISVGTLNMFNILLTAPIINRMLISRSTTQMRHASYTFILFYPVFLLSLRFIGYALLLQHGKEKIPFDISFSYISKYFFNNSPYAVALLIIMLLAVVMSTADSFLNSMTVVLLRDIVTPLTPEKQQKVKPMEWIAPLVFGGGALSIIIAYLFSSSLVVHLLSIAGAGSSCLLAPLLLYVLGFRCNKNVFFFTLLSYIVTGSVILLLAYFNFLYLDDIARWEGYGLVRKMKGMLPFIVMVNLFLCMIASPYIEEDETH